MRKLTVLLTILRKPRRLKNFFIRKIISIRIRQFSELVKIWSKAEKIRSNYIDVFPINPESFFRLSQFQYEPNIQFLEIGSFLGFTSNFLIDNFLQGKDSTLTCIDPWIEYSKSTEETIKGHDHLMNEDTYNIFKENTSRNVDKLCVQRGLSKDILPTLTSKFHFIYIDGDHSTSAAWKDALLSLPLLVKGGYILFDDYYWVERAVQHFEHSFKDKIQFINTYNNQRLYRLVVELEPNEKYDLEYFS